MPIFHMKYAYESLPLHKCVSLSLDGNVPHRESSPGKCGIPSTAAWQLQTYAEAPPTQTNPCRILGCTMPLLNRHMMNHITNSIDDSDATLFPLRQLLERERERDGDGMKRRERSLPKCSFLAALLRHSAPQLTSWAQFLTQWCQTRDSDVQRTQANSLAPAGNNQTQTGLLSSRCGIWCVWERREPWRHILLTWFH